MPVGAHTLQKTTKHQDEHTVSKVIEKPTSPNEIKWTSRQTAEDVCRDEGDMARPCFAEGLRISDCRWILIQAREVERAIYTGRHKLGNIASWTASDREHLESVCGTGFLHAAQYGKQERFAVAHRLRSCAGMEEVIPIREMRIGGDPLRVDPIDDLEVSVIAVWFAHDKALHRVGREGITERFPQRSDLARLDLAAAMSLHGIAEPRMQLGVTTGFGSPCCDQFADGGDVVHWDHLSIHRTGWRISREDGKTEGVDSRCRFDPRGCAARSAKQPCGWPSAAP